MITRALLFLAPEPEIAGRLIPRKGGALRETITRVRSDWSGDVINDEKGAVKLTLTPGDGRKRPFVADLTEAEAEELKARGGREVARRGRKPKS